MEHIADDPEPGRPGPQYPLPHLFSPFVARIASNVSLKFATILLLLNLLTLNIKKQPEANIAYLNKPRRQKAGLIFLNFRLPFGSLGYQIRLIKFPKQSFSFL